MLHIRDFTDNEFLVFATRFGTVKRLTLSSLHTARKAGIRALNLDEGDELIAVCRTDGEQDVILVTTTAWPSGSRNRMCAVWAGMRWASGASA